MRRGKFTSPAALFLYGILTLNMTNVILNEVKNPRNKGRNGLYKRTHSNLRFATTRKGSRKDSIIKNTKRRREKIFAAA